jgi:DNA repair protein RecN (Recombination protein N)
MLKSLSINNVVLIDKAEIDFSAGLCVLSGETGSGKSILLDALGLAIGFRSNLRLIGVDENKAQVTAEFDIKKNALCKNILKDHDLLDAENPDVLRIRRIITENSGSKVFANDIAIGVNLLAQIGESLVEIHGQHDQRGLLNVAYHLTILDEFCDNETLLKSLKKTYQDLRETEEKIAELKAKKEAAEREKDYLQHVVSELENADIQEGEEDELATKKDQLVGKEKILKFLSEIKAQLSESNSQMIGAIRTLTRNQNIINNYLSDKIDEFENLNKKVDEQATALDLEISNIDSLIEEVANCENNLEEIEERLFLIKSLARKHNLPISELPLLIDEAKAKLKLISLDEENESELEIARTKLLKEYQKTAEELSQKRKKSAIILAKKVEEELKFLKMEGTKFLVEFASNDAQITSPTGFDKVRFTAAINKNNFDDISKIASGGELSRFMLALKVSLLNVKSLPTIIFDEIDTGIGGSTADAVGKRLKILAKNLQVLVVTHQPQIAAKADVNFKISKTKTGDKVRTSVEKLNSDNREKEIARMLSGEKITYEAIAAARNLIAS